MNVTLRQLEAFVAVANTGSFSEAANTINVSQPALSSLVQNLETQLGTALFERDSRGATVSTSGREMLPSIERILNELNATVANVLDETLPRGGVVSMACVPSVAAIFMPPLLTEFRDEQPKIKVFIRDAIVENEGIFGLLRNGHIDFGLASPDKKKEFLFKPLYEDKLVALIHTTHPLAERDRIRWKDMTGEKIVGLSSRSYVRQLTDAAFAKSGTNWNPLGSVSLITTAAGLARSGYAIAVIPDMAAKACNVDGVKVLDIVDPVVTRPIGFLYRSMTSLTPASRTFMAFVEQKIRGQREEGRETAQ